MHLMFLNEFFGEGSYQDENFLIIDKSSLRILPTIDNSSESLLAAIVLKASYQFVGFLTDPSGNVLTDFEGNQITYDIRKLFEKFQLKFFDRYFTSNIIRVVFEYINIEPL